MEDTSKKNTRPLLYVVGLVFIFIISFSYIFNSKIDLNGDNCTYYALASSLADGHGYSDSRSGEYITSNSFPPGYPALMTIVRVFTDSFFAQKVWNGLFLLASAILLFFFVRKNKLPTSLAFVAATAVLLNYRVLHFATMMMSEMSFLFFSVLTLWFLFKMNKEKPFWKDGYFYLAILSAAYCYHIRTQGIALIVAVIGYFLFTKRWKEMLAFAAGFAVCLLPWMLRNKLGGMEQSRYFSMVTESNHWAPEQGILGLEGIVFRFFDTFKLLMTKAVPNTVIPYLSDYGALKSDLWYFESTTFGEWIIALIVCAFIGIGIWQLGKYKYLFPFYVLASFGVISLLSAPSGDRYVTSVMPFLDVSMVIGIYTVLLAAVRRFKIAKGFSPWILLVLLFFSFPKLEALHIENKSPFPPPYRNFFKLAEEVHKSLPPNTIVASRKPELFYMFSHTPVTGYIWTEDDWELINGLISTKTDYVAIEEYIGLSQTTRYLIPAIQEHPDLFTAVMQIPNSATYLFKFDREKAKQQINQTTDHE